MSPPFLEAVLAGDCAEPDVGLPKGWPDKHDRGFLELRLREMRREPDRQEWLVRALVRRGDDRRMIGHAGFHGPPGVNAVKAADAVELGYTVFEPYRGQGFATEAAQALMHWAESRHGIQHFVASVEPGNAASLALVRRLGFERTGRHWDDEDGEELEFELRISGGV